MGESVERGWYDHRKIGQPSTCTSEASRAIKAAKMFMPVNPYLQILEKYNIYGTVFWYDGAAIYSKNFSKNGLERSMKSTTMAKNQQASIYDGGRKQRRPAK